MLNSNARKHQKMLEVILVAAKEMEISFRTISSCWANLDTLIEDARRSKNNSGHNLRNCELGTRCVGATSNELPSMNFTNGAVKMQNDDIESITTLERSACSCY